MFEINLTHIRISVDGINFLIVVPAVNDAGAFELITAPIAAIYSILIQWFSCLNIVGCSLVTGKI